MYTVKFYTYCGMSYTLAENVDKEEAKSVVRNQITRARKNGKSVTKISPGRWEFETPDDAGMVSDNEGTMVIIRRKR